MHSTEPPLKEKEKPPQPPLETPEQSVWPSNYRYYYMSHYDEITLHYQDTPSSPTTNTAYPPPPTPPPIATATVRIHRPIAPKRPIRKAGLSKRAKHMDIHTRPNQEQLKDETYMQDWLSAVQHFLTHTEQGIRTDNARVRTLIRKKKQRIRHVLMEKGHVNHE